MYYIGVITSTLFIAGILGVPILFLAPFFNMLAFIFGDLRSMFFGGVFLAIPFLFTLAFLIIYSMINVIPSTATWDSYQNYFTNY
jgi:hypothetical protein